MRIPGRATLSTSISMLAVLLAVAGCATRTVSEKVYDVDRIQVSLRGEVKGGEPVDRGFNHPAIIAPVRIGNILARLDLRTQSKDGSQRAPAFATTALFTIAEGLAEALSKADSSQSVVVMSIRNDKRFGIFDRNYLTSFVAYVKGEQLYIHISRTDWEIPEKRRDRLPQPRIGDHPMDFKVLPSRAMVMVDPQSVAVDWRSSVFEKESHARVSADGQVVRRTILFESGSDERAVTRSNEPLPDNLSSAALRRLADLEEQLEKGQVSQAEYDERRAEIISSSPASP